MMELIKKNQISEQTFKVRFTILMFVCFIFGAGVLARGFTLQILPHPRLELIARRQFQSHALIRPSRGFILDRNGEPLAINVEVDSLAANPNKINNKEIIAKLLEKSIGISYKKTLRKLSEKKEFIWIKRHLSQSEMKRFKKLRLIDSSGDCMDGLWIVKESDRIFPHGKLAVHVLGGVDVDLEGIEGIELWMNEKLRGRVVSVSAIKDAYGRPTFIDAVAARSIQDGESVTLTLDASLQYEVEQALVNSVSRTNARSGTIIVMNAMSGEILAMANEPSFNPGTKKVPAEKRRNRAVTDGYEPGSTFKAILLASVLMDGGKLTDQVWGERGSFIVQGHKISEAEEKEKFEWVSLKKMIKVSSNIAAAKFALKLGAEKYYKTLHVFGFGSKTGLGFPGEIAGRIPSRKHWSSLALSNIGFGQGILVTPLQMIRAYASLLNGGWLVKPLLIKKEDPFFPVDIPHRLFSQQISTEVLKALSAATEEGGTGQSASLQGYQVAGKTGTAQMIDPVTGHYSKEKYIASFIGFPLDVEPPIVIFTSLTEPQGGYYSRQTAAPLFKEVLNSVANRCGIPMSVQPKKTIANALTQKKMKSAQSTEVSSFHMRSFELKKVPSLKKMSWIVPSFKGLTPREVIQNLKGYPFELEVNGVGIVVSHFPDLGGVLFEGDTLRLTLADP